MIFIAFLEIFSREVFSPMLALRSLNSINVHLVRVFFHFPFSKNMMMGYSRIWTLKSDCWECFLAQGHGCYGDSAALPRLFLSVGGKKLPCQQLCGILAAGENTEMMCCVSIWEFRVFF
jgi:hypothetical protein